MARASSNIGNTAHERTRGLAVAALVLLLLGMLLPSAGVRAQLSDPKFPQLTGRVVDNARLLSNEDRATIDAELAALESKSTDQVAVVTLPSLQGFEIEDFGYKLGRHWAIGQKGKDNGILLIVAPNERKVRIEAGRGLEGVMTDALSKLVIDRTILPAFRRGDFPGGIRAGVRDIKDVLLGDAEAVKARAGGARKGPQTDYTAVILLVFWLTILAFVVWAQIRQARQNPQPASLDRKRRRSGNGGVIVIPGGSGGWGQWDGGSGGGGWSGGGGDFGGGGSSGGW